MRTICWMYKCAIGPEGRQKIYSGSSCKMVIRLGFPALHAETQPVSERAFADDMKPVIWEC